MKGANRKHTRSFSRQGLRACSLLTVSRFFLFLYCVVYAGGGSAERAGRHISCIGKDASPLPDRCSPAMTRDPTPRQNSCKASKSIILQVTISRGDKATDGYERPAVSSVRHSRNCWLTIVDQTPNWRLGGAGWSGDGLGLGLGRLHGCLLLRGRGLRQLGHVPVVLCCGCAAALGAHERSRGGWVGVQQGGSRRETGVCMLGLSTLGSRKRLTRARRRGWRRRSGTPCSRR